VYQERRINEQADALPIGGDHAGERSGQPAQSMPSLAVDAPVFIQQ